MSAIDQRITFPRDINIDATVERLRFRMIQPLNDILLCVKNTLPSLDQSLHEIAVETEKLLLTVPTVNSFSLDPTPDCSLCGGVFNSADDNQSDASDFYSPGLLLRLPCKHIICSGCLKSWLAKAGSCPICRHKLTSRKFFGIETDPRNELWSRPALDSVLNAGLRWLATISAEGKTVENTFGEFRDWAAKEETAEQRAAMSAVRSFGRFSTSVEDASLHSEFGQRWIANYRIRNNSAVEAKDDPETHVSEHGQESEGAEENSNGDSEERYETDSDYQQWRSQDEADSQDERRRYQHEHDASNARERLSARDFEDDWSHRVFRWDSDDDGKEEMATEQGEENE